MAKPACKECYFKSKKGKKFFDWGDRFGHFAGPSAEDAEKCRLAHEKLMADLRANPPKIKVAITGRKSTWTDEKVAELKALVEQRLGNIEIGKRLGIATPYVAVMKCKLRASGEIEVAEK